MPQKACERYTLKDSIFHVMAYAFLMPHFLMFEIFETPFFPFSESDRENGTSKKHVINFKTDMDRK